MKALAALRPRPRSVPTLVGVGGISWSGSPSVTYSTVLGSCIAVCMWDEQVMRGGMTHFLLARTPDPYSEDTRYGQVALPRLRDHLRAAGCEQHRLRSIIVGGADLLSNMRTIGTENTEFALEWLRSEGIPIVKKDFGGSRARALRFTPTTGKHQITLIPNGV